MKWLLSLLFALLLLATVLSADSNPIIYTDDVRIIDIGTIATTNIMLTNTPYGLSGYNLTLSLSDSTIATIISVAFPPWATLHSNSSMPSSSVWAKAVDLNKQVEPGATDVLLATLTLESQQIGNSFINISINNLDDDNGYPITTTLQNTTITVAKDEETPPTLPPSPPLPPPQPPKYEEDENENPIANADGPYYGFVDVPLTFDGAGSTDDGTIKSYEWDFGDKNTGTGVSPIHTYVNPDNYTITLTVTDNGEKTDINITYAIITDKPNFPPDIPTVNGTNIGHKDTDYNYTATTIDLDNDTIRYIFDWDDNTNNISSPFLNSGGTFNASHNWTSAGVYIINVYAEDDKNAISGNRSFIVVIDTYFINEIGYFIDDNADGIYDSFYSNETENETQFELQENGEYKIDSDGDGKYDYIYDPISGAITNLKGKETTDITTFLWIIIVGIIVMILIIAIIIGLYRYRKR